MRQTRVVQPDPYWLVAAAFVIADQLIKAFTVSLIKPVTIGSVTIGRIVNTYGAFGLDISNSALIGIGIALCIILLVLLMYRASSPPARLGLWLILAGAVSNLIDRIVNGGVIDLVSIGPSSRFNLADVLIVLGALSVLRSTWWRGARE